mmetsp:Transcript_1436/g.3018  ORF Transcript_1436/g.3018 Transcript_1436/m.3018 type:complete len:99 (-) Transcript_1436:879-1175(-)
MVECGGQHPIIHNGRKGHHWFLIRQPAGRDTGLERNAAHAKPTATRRPFNVQFISPGVSFPISTPAASKTLPAKAAMRGGQTAFPIIRYPSFRCAISP